MSIPAGWYPDPQQQDQLRYWDGAGWTEHQAPAQASSPAPQEQGGGYGAASAPQAGPSVGYGAAPAPGTADQTSPYGSFSDADSAPQGYGEPGYGAQPQNGFGPPTQGTEPFAYGGGYGQPGQAPGG